MRYQTSYSNNRVATPIIASVTKTRLKSYAFNLFSSIDMVSALAIYTTEFKYPLKNAYIYSTKKNSKNPLIWTVISLSFYNKSFCFFI